MGVGIKLYNNETESSWKMLATQKELHNLERGLEGKVEGKREKRKKPLLAFGKVIGQLHLKSSFPIKLITF